MKFLRFVGAAPQLPATVPSGTTMARFATFGPDPLRQCGMVESWSAMTFGGHTVPGRANLAYTSCGLAGDTEMIGRDLHVALAIHMAKNRELQNRQNE